jgi:deoxycytidylate deaminase
VIVWPSEGALDNWVGACNSRQSNCCNGVCARNRFNTFHGGRVEIGAEVHSETAALIQFGKRHDNATLILVGYVTGGKQLKGKDVLPCHTCALNIKFAGFKFIYVRDDDDTIIPVSIAEIIERRELEWET